MSEAGLFLCGIVAGIIIGASATLFALADRGNGK